MVRTPRWITNYKTRIFSLFEQGKSHAEIALILGIDEEKVSLCELASNNYHLSYDSTPEDWVSPEFIYEFEEHKATLLSPELVKEIRKLSDAEMKMLLQYVEEAPISEEEREWAANKFYELQAIAHGLSETLSPDPSAD